MQRTFPPGGASSTGGTCDLEIPSGRLDAEYRADLDLDLPSSCASSSDVIGSVAGGVSARDDHVLEQQGRHVSGARPRGSYPHGGR